MRALIPYAVVMAVAAVSAASAPAQTRRGPNTDQTVQVSRGSQLLVNNFAGEVIVRAWDRDQVRVLARHGSRVRVSLRQEPTAVRISSSSSSGTTSVDYDITVPAWMPVRVSGPFNYIEIQGVEADIAAETVRGDVLVKGGSGVITLKSIEGEVHAEDTKGRLTASSVNEGVTIVRPSGEISAETINGEIAITDAHATSVEATTVNGDVRYTGTIAANGLYRLTTHEGDILMGVPDDLSATVSVRTYQGEFRASRFTADAMELTHDEYRRGRRQTFAIGRGTAQIELESFGGEIRLRKLSEIPPARERKR